MREVYVSRPEDVFGVETEDALITLEEKAHEVTQSDSLEAKNSSYQGKLSDSETFDLASFFGQESSQEPDTEDAIDTSGKIIEQTETPQLLITLRDTSNESIATLTSRVTAETFAVGASFTSGVFSALGSLVGSCGVFCAHGLGALAQTSSISSGFSGLVTPGFHIDSHGHFHIDGDIDSLSKMTGFSKHDLLMGKFSSEEILKAFFDNFGGGMSLLFGVGFLELLSDSFFDCFFQSYS